MPAASNPDGPLAVGQVQPTRVDLTRGAPLGLAAMQAHALNEALRALLQA